MPCEGPSNNVVVVDVDSVLGGASVGRGVVVALMGSVIEVVVVVVVVGFGGMVCVVDVDVVEGLDVCRVTVVVVVLLGGVVVLGRVVVAVVVNIVL